MPAEHHEDPMLLNAMLLNDMAEALTRSSTAALEASHELLAHYGDTGDAPTQRAVDTLIDHAADALRALTDSLADISGEVQATAATPTPRQATPWRRPDAGPASGPPRPGPGRRG
jgi:hypothetical protein